MVVVIDEVGGPDRQVLAETFLLVVEVHIKQTK